VLRETEFYGLPIHVRRGVFIPRPETELLVDEALAILPADMPARILDIGTGSGCIALAIAAHRPRARVIGIDISATALRVARSNARRLGIRNVRFAYCDILHSLPPEAPFDLVVCNPPYIPAAEVPHLQPEVCLFEPYEALTDGGDGLLFYRRLAELVPFLLHPQGSLILELADGAAAAVVPLFQNRLRALRLRADYAGVQRVLIGAVDLSA
jgi:release factor glutamine methyltransferase